MKEINLVTAVLTIIRYFKHNNIPFNYINVYDALRRQIDRKELSITNSPFFPFEVDDIINELYDEALLTEFSRISIRGAWHYSLNNIVDIKEVKRISAVNLVINKLKTKLNRNIRTKIINYVINRENGVTLKAIQSRLKVKGMTIQKIYDLICDCPELKIYFDESRDIVNYCIDDVRSNDVVKYRL